MAKKTDKIFSIGSNKKELNENFRVCQFISVFESAYIIFKIGNLNRFHFRFFNFFLDNDTIRLENPHIVIY